MSRGPIEYGYPHTIDMVDGRKFVAPGRLETKATETAAPARAPDSPPGGVPRTVWAPETETTTWLAVPEETLTPQTKRAAEIALEAARLHLPGLPEGLTVRYMLPHTREMARLYADITGVEPKTFTNVERTGGTHFPDRPLELWVSVAQDAGAVARFTVHEAVHCWRHRVGAKGLTQEQQEEEADALADELLPLVVAAAAAEGGLGPGPGVRW